MADEKPNPTPDIVKVYGEIQMGKNTFIRVFENTPFKGVIYVHIRKIIKLVDGTERFTMKGIAVPKEKIEGLIKILQEVNKNGN